MGERADFGLQFSLRILVLCLGFYQPEFKGSCSLGISFVKKTVHGEPYSPACFAGSAVRSTMVR